MEGYIRGLEAALDALKKRNNYIMRARTQSIPEIIEELQKDHDQLKRGLDSGMYDDESVLSP